MSKDNKVGGTSDKMPTLLNSVQQLAKSPGVAKLYILTPEMLQKLGLTGHMTAKKISQDTVKKPDDSPAQGSQQKTDQKSVDTDKKSEKIESKSKKVDQKSNKLKDTVNRVVEKTVKSNKRKRESISTENLTETPKTLKSSVPKKLELNGTGQEIPPKGIESDEDAWSTPKTKKRKRRSNALEVLDSQPQNNNNENTQSTESKDESNKSTPGIRTSKRVVKVKKYDDYILTDDILTYGSTSDAAGKIKKRRSSANTKKTDSAVQLHNNNSKKTLTEANTKEKVAIDEDKHLENKIDSADLKTKDSEEKSKFASQVIEFKVPETPTDFGKIDLIKTYTRQKCTDKDTLQPLVVDTKPKENTETPASKLEIPKTRNSESPGKKCSDVSDSSTDIIVNKLVKKVEQSKPSEKCTIVKVVDRKFKEDKTPALKPENSGTESSEKRYLSVIQSPTNVRRQEIDEKIAILEPKKDSTVENTAPVFEKTSKKEDAVVASMLKVSETKPSEFLGKSLIIVDQTPTNSNQKESHEMDVKSKLEVKSTREKVLLKTATMKKAVETVSQLDVLATKSDLLSDKPSFLVSQSKLIIGKKDTKTMFEKPKAKEKSITKWIELKEASNSREANEVSKQKILSNAKKISPEKIPIGVPLSLTNISRKEIPKTYEKRKPKGKLPAGVVGIKDLREEKERLETAHIQKVSVVKKGLLTEKYGFTVSQKPSNVDKTTIHGTSVSKEQTVIEIEKLQDKTCKREDEAAVAVTHGNTQAERTLFSDEIDFTAPQKEIKASERELKIETTEKSDKDIIKSMTEVESVAVMQENSEAELLFVDEPHFIETNRKKPQKTNAKLQSQELVTQDKETKSRELEREKQGILAMKNNFLSESIPDSLPQSPTITRKEFGKTCEKRKPKEIRTSNIVAEEIKLKSGTATQTAMQVSLGTNSYPSIETINSKVYSDTSSKTSGSKEKIEVDCLKLKPKKFQEDKIEQAVDAEPPPLLLPDKTAEIGDEKSEPRTVFKKKEDSSSCPIEHEEKIVATQMASLAEIIGIGASQLDLLISEEKSKEHCSSKPGKDLFLPPNEKEDCSLELKSPRLTDKKESLELLSRSPNEMEKSIISNFESPSSPDVETEIIYMEWESPSSPAEYEEVVTTVLDSPMSVDMGTAVVDKGDEVSDIELHPSSSPAKYEEFVTTVLESSKSPGTETEVIDEKAKVIDMELHSSSSLAECKEIVTTVLESPTFPGTKTKVIDEKAKVIDIESPCPSSPAEYKKVVTTVRESSTSADKKIEVVDEGGKVSAIELHPPSSPAEYKKDVTTVKESPTSADQQTEVVDGKAKDIDMELHSPSSPVEHEEVVTTVLKPPTSPGIKPQVIDETAKFIDVELPSPSSPVEDKEVVTTVLGLPTSPGIRTEIIDEKAKVIDIELHSPSSPDTYGAVSDAKLQSPMAPAEIAAVIGIELGTLRIKHKNRETSAESETVKPPDEMKKAIETELESPSSPEEHTEVDNSWFEASRVSSSDEDEGSIALEVKPSSFPNKEEKSITSKMKTPMKSSDEEKKFIASESKIPRSRDKREKSIASKMKTSRSSDKEDLQTIASVSKTPRYSDKKEKSIAPELKTPKSSDKRKKSIAPKLKTPKSTDKEEKSIASEMKAPRVSDANTKAAEATVLELESPRSKPRKKKFTVSQSQLTKSSNKKQELNAPELQLPDFPDKEKESLKPPVNDIPSALKNSNICRNPKIPVTFETSSNVESVEHSLPNNSSKDEPMEIEDSLPAESISVEVPRVPRKRGRPKKTVVVPEPEVSPEPNVHKQEEPTTESLDDVSTTDDTLVESSCRTKKPVQRYIDETDGKGLSEGSEGDDDDETFEVNPRRRGRRSGQMSKGLTGGRGRRKGRGRGRGGGRGGVSATDSEYVPRIAAPAQEKENDKKPDSGVNTKAPKEQIPTASEVECGKCKAKMLKKQWARHNLTTHNSMGWLTGTEEPDFEKDPKLLRSILAVALKKKSSLVCETCGDSKRSANGFISHLQFCGKSEEERISLLVTCPICGNTMMPSSMEMHERTHRQSKKSVHERKWEETLQARDASTSKGKRKAAEKAATKIAEFTQLVKEDGEEKKQRTTDDLSDLVKKPRSAKDPPNVWKSIWKNELATNGKAFCRQPICQFTGESVEAMCEHNAACPFTPSPLFLCKICHFSSEYEEAVTNHAREKHWDGMPESGSDFGHSSSSENSDIEPEVAAKQAVLKKEVDRYRPQSTGIKFLDIETPIHPKWPICYPPALRWTMKFELENYRLRLFEKLTPRSMNLLEYHNSLEYLPKISRSMQVKMSDTRSEPTDWVRWERFQGSVNKGIPSIFTGGPVWALAWLPIPAPLYDRSVDQYVAVSTHPTMESTYSIGRSHAEKNIIQIWNMGPLNHTKNPSVQVPEFSYGIAHDKGTVWCMEWCPSGCYEHEQFCGTPADDKKDKKRMGLLAAACSDGCVHIFSLPFPEELNFVRKENDPPDYRPIYATKPVLTLTVNISGYEKGEQNWQCTCLNWCKSLGHDTIIAGFSNGFVALWDPSTTSPFLVNTRGETTIIDPFHGFYAHGHSISSVQMIPFTGRRFFYTTGWDRLTKLWDMEDLTMNVGTAKRGIVTAGSLLTNWAAYVTAYDDAYGVVNTYTYLVSLRQPATKVTSVLPTKSTIYGLGTSDYGNCIGQGTAAGEILVIFPHQLWNYKDMERDIPKKRWLASTTEIVDFKANPNSKGVKPGVKRKASEKEYDYKPDTYDGCDDRYGMIFHDALTRQKRDTRRRHAKPSYTEQLSAVNIEQYPFMCINRLSWNPNAWSYLWMAIGYQNGLVRFLNFNAVAIERDLRKSLPLHVKSMLNKATTLEQNIGGDVNASS